MEHDGTLTLVAAKVSFALSRDCGALGWLCLAQHRRRPTGL
jgi:hypothetical protein